VGRGVTVGAAVASVVICGVTSGVEIAASGVADGAEAVAVNISEVIVAVCCTAAVAV
jgi:hypothetical protein